MALLENAHRIELATKFRDELVHPVEIRVRSRADGIDPILDEIAELSPKLSVVREGEKPEETIEIVVRGVQKGVVRFVGLPTGYEFPTFIDSLFSCSTGQTSLGDVSRQALAALDAHRHLRVFTTPT